MEIMFKNVSCGYSGADVLTNVNLSFKTGEFWCILGANGIGKTTLFKTLLGVVELKGGEIFIDGRNIQRIKSKDIAQYISYVPQAKSYSLQYSVLDIVLMGRAAHIKQFSYPSKNDYAIAMKMLRKLGIENLSDCMYSELSGGEQQVVLIARALAQESKFIVMDEPASNLDFEHQKRILDVMKSLASNNVGIIMSSHFPDHAFYCNAGVVLIKKNKSIVQGNAEDIITSENLKEGYGVDVGIICGMDLFGKPVKACRLL
jgi:iron complex transport system ATP-binding protein